MIITVHEKLWNDVTHFLNADIFKATFVMIFPQKFINGVISHAYH